MNAFIGALFAQFTPSQIMAGLKIVDSTRQINDSIRRRMSNHRELVAA